MGFNGRDHYSRLVNVVQQYEEELKEFKQKRDDEERALDAQEDEQKSCGHSR